MECYENGRERTLQAGRAVNRKRAGGKGLHLAFSSAPDSTPFSMRVNLVPYCPPEPYSTEHHPFINNMDEISYWIYTKRAPCLFNYDNIIKKQIEQAHCSKTKPPSIQSACEEASSPKKKRKKLKIQDEDSVSSEKPQNVYFETSKCDNQKTAPSSGNTEIASDVDFNIKHPTQPAKRLKRNCQTSQKKTKLVTSTPKATNLRRSLRKAQQNNNTQLNSSFEPNELSFVNGQEEKSAAVQNHSQNKTKLVEKNAVLNGQFEDLSDVSGLTANYIRSTKIHSSKTPRKLRNRSSRNLIKDSKQSEDKVLVCTNKSVNAQLPDTTVKSSSDSSQNLIQLVSVRNNEKSTRINKSTSPSKCMDSKLDKGNASNNKTNKDGKELKISFQSKSSGTSRYPKRQRNLTIGDSEQNCSKINSTNVNSTRQARKSRNNKRDKLEPRAKSGRKSFKKDQDESITSSVAFNVASHHKEVQNDSIARCLRSRCKDKSRLNTRDKSQRVDSVSDRSDKIQVNMQADSSTPRCTRQVKKSMNKTQNSKSGRRFRDKSGRVDSISDKSDKVQDNGKVDSSTPKCVRKRSMNKLGTRDSLRDKSGFAACFSDSDSDSEPLRRKFFC